MLKKSQRLKKHEVKFILKKGHDKSSKFFLIKYLNSNDNLNRYSVIISKKIYRLAVKRNKLRRQIYNIIKEFSENADQATTHTNIVLIPKKQIPQIQFKEIKDDIKQILTSKPWTN